MPSRRQEKVARVVKEVVSDAIRDRLGDPRIEGIVSVTEVDMSPDLRNANVFISIMGTDEASQHKTFSAIEHASRYMQKLLGHKLTTKFCPRLHFFEDEKFKKTLETLRLIDEASEELNKNRPIDPEAQD